jgi:hypothetical protein
VYDIQVRRAKGETTMATGAGARLENGALILPLVADLATHHIEVELGTDVGPHYRPSAMESGP